MLNQYSYDYGRYAWATSEGQGSYESTIVNRDPSDFYAPFLAGGRHALAYGGQAVNAGATLRSRLFTRPGTFTASWGNQASVGYDIASSIVEMATGERNSAANYVAGTLGGGIMVGLMHTMKKMAGSDTALYSKFGNLFGLTPLGKGIMTASAAGSIIADFVKYTAVGTKDVNREMRRRASYEDADDVVGMFRSRRSSNVIDPNNMANFAAIARSVQSNLEVIRNPALGYMNRIKGR